MAQFDNPRVSGERSAALAACAPRPLTIADVIRALFYALRSDAPQSPWYSGVVR
jgi:hypothetical protein